MSLIINGSNLRFGWDKNNPILSIDSFQVERGQSLLIRGNSGSGKTTLLSILSGLYPLDSGTLMINGTALNELNAAQRDAFRANEMGVIFQQFNLLPFLTVMENIELPTLFRKDKSAVSEARIQSLLKTLNLEADLLHRKAQQLSVGQQQRVAIVRALAHKPPIVLADEPTSALDDDNRLAFLSALQTLCDEQQTTLVMATHDARFDEQFDELMLLS